MMKAMMTENILYNGTYKIGLLGKVEITFGNIERETLH